MTRQVCCQLSSYLRKTVALAGLALGVVILASSTEEMAGQEPKAKPFIDPEGRLDVGDIYKQVAFWQSTGQVSRDADPKSFIDLSFVQGHFNVPK